MFGPVSRIVLKENSHYNVTNINAPEQCLCLEKRTRHSETLGGKHISKLEE